MAGKDTFKAFQVAFGGEPFHLDRLIEATRQSRRRVTVVDGGAVTETQLVDLCETMSEDPRTIVVDNAQAIKGGKELRRYVDAHLERDRSLILVAVVRAEKLSELWSYVASKGKRLEWAKIKPWQKDVYLDFVAAEATRAGVLMRKDACAALYLCTGPDLYRLANEVRKLGVYVGASGEITTKVVAEIATRTPHAEPHMIAEAALAKDLRMAMTLFSAMCVASGETHYGAVVFQLMKQVENAVVVRSLQDKGVPSADIVALLGVNAWRFDETMAPIAKKHDLRSLVGYMGLLSRLDADVKSSSSFKRTKIEMTMLTISS